MTADDDAPAHAPCAARFSCFDLHETEVIRVGTGTYARRRLVL